MRRSDQPGSRHSERMPEGNGAAVRVDVVGVVGEAEEPEHGKRLRGERFIEFHDLDIG